MQEKRGRDTIICKRKRKREKEAVEKKDRQREAKSRESKKMKYLKKKTEKYVKKLLSDETISKSTAKALTVLHQTQIKNTHLYQANVCVLCGFYIIGTEPVTILNKKMVEAPQQEAWSQPFHWLLQT